MFGAVFGLFNAEIRSFCGGIMLARGPRGLDMGFTACKLRRSCENRHSGPREQVPLRKSKQIPFSCELT